MPRGQVGRVTPCAPGQPPVRFNRFTTPAIVTFARCKGIWFFSYRLMTNAARTGLTRPTKSRCFHRFVEAATLGRQA
jgi:hypothetical protein